MDIALALYLAAALINIITYLLELNLLILRLILY